MKAPILIHQALLADGFVYGDGHYMGMAQGRPFSQEVRFDRCSDPKGSYLIELMIFYPSVESAVGIVPLNTTCLRADGKLWQVPDHTQEELYFFLSGSGPDHQTIVNWIRNWLAVLMDREAMVRLADYLMGGESPSEEFRYVEDSPYLRRRESVYLLQTKIGYLNYLGRFDEAREVLKAPMVGAKKDDPFLAKLSGDVQSRAIAPSTGHMKYLGELGLRISVP